MSAPCHPEVIWNTRYHNSHIVRHCRYFDRVYTNIKRLLGFRGGDCKTGTDTYAELTKRGTTSEQRYNSNFQELCQLSDVCA